VIHCFRSFWMINPFISFLFVSFPYAFPDIIP
jgi:hypothetical protein